MRLPRLWVAYDFTSMDSCLSVLDKIVAAHPDPGIIHEIGRPTLMNAVLEGFPIVREFRRRLSAGQLVVADFKGFDVPYSAEGQFYYRHGVGMITVMASAPDEAIDEAVAGAREARAAVAFDLMSHQSDAAKALRARALAGRGAQLVSCHTGWNEQAAGKQPDELLERVFAEIRGTDTQMVAMGGITPERVRRLRPYAEAGALFAVVAGAAITRADDPAAVTKRFLEEITALAA
ncbi:orotidine 5'-phosphate decarboxylase / HUMPS family protein [Streptomyces sp. NPDC001719]